MHSELDLKILAMLYDGLLTAVHYLGDLAAGEPLYRDIVKDDQLSAGKTFRFVSMLRRLSM